MKNKKMKPLYKLWEEGIRKQFKIERPQNRCIKCKRELTDSYSRKVGFGTCCIEYAKGVVMENIVVDDDFKRKIDDIISGELRNVEAIPEDAELPEAIKISNQHSFNKNKHIWKIGDKHKYWGKVGAMGIREGEPYRMFIDENKVVSLMPLDTLDDEDLVKDD